MKFQNQTNNQNFFEGPENDVSVKFSVYMAVHRLVFIIFVGIITDKVKCIF